jgi:hypothetical protein
MVSSMPFRIFLGGVVDEPNGIIVKAEDEPVRAEDGLADIKAEILAFEETVLAVLLMLLSIRFCLLGV